MAAAHRCGAFVRCIFKGIGCVSRIRELKRLRKIHGPVRDPNGWRVRTNDELQVMCGKPNSVTIKLRRLEWAGYLIRMSDDRTIRKYFWGEQKKKQEDQNEGSRLY